MNQTFSLSIDVPDGYEATGEYRKAVSGDIILLSDGTAMAWVALSPTAEKHFILRRAWTPPTWLPIDNWLYFNGSKWRLTNRQPRMLNNEVQLATGATVVDVAVLAAILGQTWSAPLRSNWTLIYQL